MNANSYTNDQLAEALAVIRLLVECFPRDDMLDSERFALETGKAFLSRSIATNSS